MLIVRSFGLRGRSRAQTVALAVAALAIGAVLLAVGLMVLAGLAAAGTVVGLGVLAWRRLTGRAALGGARPAAFDRDPSKEVPAQRVEVRRIDGPNG